MKVELYLKLLDILELEQHRPSKAYLVSELRKAVHMWRDQNHPSITDTTNPLTP